jgi:hypothetical protein
LYYSPNVISTINRTRIRSTGHAARIGQKRNAYRGFCRKSERTRPHGRSMPSWEDNVKVDIKEMGDEGVDWIYLAQDRDKWQTIVNTTVWNLLVA